MAPPAAFEPRTAGEPVLSPTGGTPAVGLTEKPLGPAELAALVRAAVEESLAPVRSALLDLERRLGPIERRAAPDPTANASPEPWAAPVPTRVPVGRAGPVAVPVYAELSLAGSADRVAFDGRRRRRRLVWGLVLSLVVLFGGLFLLLAGSYAHTPN